YYTSTNPGSFFTNTRVAALPVDNGVITLFNNTLKIMTANKAQVQELPEGQAYLDALKTHFGIELDAPYE
ncbi:arylamine N-acetyltransferase, partial [Candidatus Saccharibacteria bacterium]|nr:arylamine N-acetyltransferase [Candidatus Saccharibacteria bacterium]NIS38912.1 arylamine N-acetyltransferase [Candidatus Saccharibacteria bacterium]NIV04369.1 arylamine N-acetyltransferase [Calditrichia bacterium]NIV72902.1 arylamine N-acetyltransferase [Calditrichia bacterium]NIW00133.1 arylamine N-acetyltransferase [Candidatus Saccharibacteria bacterium]